MQKRNTRFERGRVRDQRQVLRLLHRRRAKHCPAGRARGHHIAVIAEDRQRLCRERSRGDVKHGRRQFAGDLVHVRDHQQQSLRGSERRAERAGLKRTVNHSGSAAFALHLDHGRNRAPQILHAGCRPRVRPFAHRRCRRNRINRNHLVERVSDARHRFIRIQHFVCSLHVRNVSVIAAGRCTFVAFCCAIIAPATDPVQMQRGNLDVGRPSNAQQIASLGERSLRALLFFGEVTEQRQANE